MSSRTEERVSVSVFVDLSDRERLMELARENDRSMSSVIRRAIAEHLAAPRGSHDASTPSEPRRPERPGRGRQPAGRSANERRPDVAATEVGYETATRSRNIKSLAAGMMIATRDFAHGGEHFRRGISRAARGHEILRDPKVRALFVAADSREGRALEHRGGGSGWKLERDTTESAWEIRGGGEERQHLCALTALISSAPTRRRTDVAKSPYLADKLAVHPAPKIVAPPQPTLKKN